MGRRARLTGNVPPLNDFQRRNLAAVCSIGADRLTKVADALDSAGFVFSKPEIDRLIDDAVGEVGGPQLSSFVFGLTAGFRQDDTVPEDTLRMLSRFVSAYDGNDQKYDAWEACEPVLARLLNSPSVRLTSKALDISYDFERLYLSGKFITSIRPVFDEPRERIMGGAIVQTLRLAYLSGSEAQATLSIALDRADILQLRKSCDEALAKGAELARVAASDWKLPTIMSNDETVA